MTDLIKKLEEVRDALYDRVMNNEDEYIERDRESHYWIRLNRTELKAVDNLVSDEIRKLQMDGGSMERIDLLYGILNAMSDDE